MFNRKLIVSASISIRSTTLTVIRRISSFNRDSQISRTRQASDIAAATAGRRNSAIQVKLKKPQESTKASCGTRRASVLIRATNPARCNVTSMATGSVTRARRASAANERSTDKVAMAAGGMDLSSGPEGGADTAGRRSLS